MIRTSIKTAVASALYRTGIDRAVGRLSGARHTPLMIGYHRVVENFEESAQTAIPSLLISRDMLQRHLDWIGRRYRFVGLDELGVMLESGDSITEPVAAITFDDGYQDFYDHALPVLQKTGVPAALFVVTGLVGTTQGQTHDRLYHLLSGRNGGTPLAVGLPIPNIAGMSPYSAMRALIESVPLATLQRVIEALESDQVVPEDALSRAVSWETLERIHRAGVVVGSHTRSHIVMTNETPEVVHDEVRESRSELERRLGVTVRHFAYPGGKYHSGSVSAVADAGYRFAYTSCSHRSIAHPQLTVPRTILWQGSCLDSHQKFSDALMSCQVHGTFDIAAGCRQDHGNSPAGLTKVKRNAAL